MAFGAHPHSEEQAGVTIKIQIKGVRLRSIKGVIYMLPCPCGRGCVPKTTTESKQRLSASLFREGAATIIYYQSNFNKYEQINKRMSRSNGYGAKNKKVFIFSILGHFTCNVSGVMEGTCSLCRCKGSFLANENTSSSLK